MDRDGRQQAVFKWTRETFGEATNVPSERALRLLEEAIELAQAEGVTLDSVWAVAEHVYLKPAGQPEQEAGGVGLTLLAYCASRGFSADGAEERERQRVLAIDPAHFRERHNKKADAGIAARAPEE